MSVILIVEDEATLRSIEEKSLESHGHKVVSFASAEAAKEWLLGHDADLLILDIILPGQGGVDFMLEMHSYRNAKMKIIFTSGYVDMSHDMFKTLVEKFGSFEPLQKPFTIEEFVARVDEVLNLPLETAEE